MGEGLKTEEPKTASRRENFVELASLDLSLKKKKKSRFAFFLNIKEQVDS